MKATFNKIKNIIKRARQGEEKFTGNILTDLMKSSHRIKL